MRLWKKKRKRKEIRMEKFLSRKFLLSAAAFLAAFCTGVAGVFPP